MRTFTLALCTVMLTVFLILALTVAPAILGAYLLCHFDNPPHPELTGVFSLLFWMLTSEVFLFFSERKYPLSSFQKKYLPRHWFE